MPQTPFFTDEDLTNWLGFTVRPAKAVLAERVVWGWLQPLLAVDERPDVSGDENPQMFAWALELGGIAHENPSGLSSKQFGDVAEEYSAERRDAILELVRSGGLSSSGSPKPRGCFPPAPCYPEPATGSSYRS